MIARFEFRRYALPFAQAVRTSRGAWKIREGILIRLQHPDGSIGYGEAAPIPGFGDETIDDVSAACRRLNGELTEEGLSAAKGSLRSALESARSCSCRGGDLLRPGSDGSSKTRPLQVAALLPAGRAVLDSARIKADIGFRTFKWKVGAGDIGDEIALLDDLCAVLPEGSKLRLDANGGLDRRKAERWLDRCSDRPVEFVEQPTEDEDILRGLAADYPVPIALDESISGDADLEKWLNQDWPGLFVIKPALHSPVGLRALIGRQAFESRVVFSSALETAIGARIALQFAMEWPVGDRAVGFGVWPLFADPRFDGPSAAPSIQQGDLDILKPELAWTALG